MEERDRLAPRVSRTGPFRQQLPAVSPLSLRALAAAITALRPGADSPVLELEALLQERYSADGVLLCGSGTQALLTAITLAWHASGAEGQVALPAFSCFDVATAAIGAGVPVDFYDIDPQTLSPDLDSLDRALQAGARVVVVGSLYGVPVEWNAVGALAARFGATLVEDAAQGHGASWDGSPLGSLAPLSVLSFGRGKGWTGGGGGALLLRGFPDGASEAGTVLRGSPRTLRPLFAAFVQWAIGRPAVYRLPASLPFLHLGETTYHPPGPPRRIEAAAAALALATRAQSDREADVRRATALEWTRHLVDFAVATTIRLPSRAHPGFLRFPVLLPAGLGSFPSRDEARRTGIAPSYPTPLPQLAPLAAVQTRSVERWPGAEALARSLVTLPTHSRLAVEDRARIITLLSHCRSA